MESFHIIQKIKIVMICSQNTTYFSIVSILIGALLPLLIPLIHFGVVSRLWDQYSFSVDIYNCRNTCWDTVFKGNIYIKYQISFSIPMIALVDTP